jgi:hypothetical protein
MNAVLSNTPKPTWEGVVDSVDEDSLGIDLPNKPIAWSEHGGFLPKDEYELLLREYEDKLAPVNQFIREKRNEELQRRINLHARRCAQVADASIVEFRKRFPL